MSYEKLVRDKIPEIIKANGGKPNVRILSDEEYRIELIKKLSEEVLEFTTAPTLEERADIAEVLRNIDALMGFSQQDIENARVSKELDKGGFNDRVYLEGVG